MGTTARGSRFALGPEKGGGSSSCMKSVSTLVRPSKGTSPVKASKSTMPNE
jgi:hypothetical protein